MCMVDITTSMKMQINGIVTCHWPVFYHLLMRSNVMSVLWIICLRDSCFFCYFYYHFLFGVCWYSIKLREYVDDTEDYINIMLDDKQNHLLQMGVMLTTATLVASAFVVVAALFGMNINIELFDKTKAGMPEFLWTIGGGATGSIFLYIIAIAWCKHKRLLE